MTPEQPCPQCERYKEASFRDAIEFSKFRTMLQIAGDRIRDARNEALEEAAKLCEDHGHSNGSIRGSHKHLAAAIRALKDKP